MGEIADISTEEKIKEAARIVFTQKGFQGTKIRDIAAQADINLSLVNYYFRSKEKLFEIIMADTIQKLSDKIHPVLYDTQTTLIEKIGLIADHYIDYVLENPDIPFFVLSEVMSGSKSLPIFKNKEFLLGSHFSTQLIALSQEGKIKFHPAQILMNIAGMIIFPFLSRPMLTSSEALSDKEFIEIVKARKKLIPVWMEHIING